MNILGLNVGAASPPTLGLHARIRGYLKENPNADAEELAEALNASPARVERALKRVKPVAKTRRKSRDPIEAAVTRRIREAIRRKDPAFDRAIQARALREIAGAPDEEKDPRATDPAAQIEAALGLIERYQDLLPGSNRGAVDRLVDAVARTVENVASSPVGAQLLTSALRPRQGSLPAPANPPPAAATPAASTEPAPSTPATPPATPSAPAPIEDSTSGTPATATEPDPARAVVAELLTIRELNPDPTEAAEALDGLFVFWQRTGRTAAAAILAGLPTATQAQIVALFQPFADTPDLGPRIAAALTLPTLQWFKATQEAWRALYDDDEGGDDSDGQPEAPPEPPTNGRVKAGALAHGH